MTGIGAGETPTRALAAELNGRFVCMPPDGSNGMQRGVLRLCGDDSSEEYKDQIWFRVDLLASHSGHEEQPLLSYPGLKPLSDGTLPTPLLPLLQPLSQMTAPELSKLSRPALKAELQARGVERGLGKNRVDLATQLHELLQEAIRQVAARSELEDQLERGEINEQQARHVLTILQDLDGELREAQQGSEQKQEETWEEQEQHAAPAMQLAAGRDDFHGKQEWEMRALEEDRNALEASLMRLEALMVRAEEMDITWDDDEEEGTAFSRPPPPP